MPKIIVLDGYTSNPGDLSWKGLEALGECIIYDRSVASQVVERIGDAPIVLTNKVPISASDIAQLPTLRYIGIMATGINVVDVEAALKAGIVVTNVPAYSTASVAQLAMAHLLNITMRVDHYAVDTRNGVWSRNADFTYTDTPLIELDGMTMGIVGMGRIGRAVARMAQGMGMRVMAYSSQAADALPEGVIKAPSLDEMLAQADVVSLHVPLTPTTYHLIDARRLSLMKPTAILLNTARGALVDEVALAQALTEGRLWAAGIDALSQEPPALDNPLVNAPNCYITPHLGWATTQSRIRLLDVTIANVSSYLAGKTQNRVTRVES